MASSSTEAIVAMQTTDAAPADVMMAAATAATPAAAAAAPFVPTKQQLTFLLSLTEDMFEQRKQTKGANAGKVIVGSHGLKSVHTNDFFASQLESLLAEFNQTILKREKVLDEMLYKFVGLKTKLEVYQSAHPDLPDESEAKTTAAAAGKKKITKRKQQDADNEQEVVQRFITESAEAKDSETTTDDMANIRAYSKVKRQKVAQGDVAAAAAASLPATDLSASSDVVAPSLAVVPSLVALLISRLATGESFNALQHSFESINRDMHAITTTAISYGPCSDTQKAELSQRYDERAAVLARMISSLANHTIEVNNMYARIMPQLLQYTSVIGQTAQTALLTQQHIGVVLLYGLTLTHQQAQALRSETKQPEFVRYIVREVFKLDDSSTYWSKNSYQRAKKKATTAAAAATSDDDDDTTALFLSTEQQNLLLGALKEHFKAAYKPKEGETTEAQLHTKAKQQIQSSIGRSRQGLSSVIKKEENQ